MIDGLLAEREYRWLLGYSYISPEGVPLMLSSAGGFAETVSAIGSRYDTSASFNFNMSGLFFGT